MPAFGFYAARADVPAVLDFVLAGMGCRVFDAYSAPDEPLGEYRTAAEILAAYPEDAPSGRYARPVHLVLWRPDLGPEPLVRRIELRPAALPGRTFRHAAEGLGLLDLQFGQVRDGRLAPSNLAVNSEARARRWTDTSSDRFGPVEAWCWPAVARAMRQLQYHLARRLAVGRHGSRPLLPAAAAAVQNGLVLTER